MLFDKIFYIYKGMKDTFVDIKAKLDNNTTVIIEMQVLNNEGFEKGKEEEKKDLL